MGKLQIGKITGGGNLEGKLAADGFHSAQIGTDLTYPNTYIEHRDLRRLGLFCWSSELPSNQWRIMGICFANQSKCENCSRVKAVLHLFVQSVLFYLFVHDIRTVLRPIARSIVKDQIWKNNITFEKHSYLAWVEKYMWSVPISAKILPDVTKAGCVQGVIIIWPSCPDGHWRRLQPSWPTGRLINGQFSWT